MSFDGDNKRSEDSVEVTLKQILAELKLLNARIEEEFNTGIKLEDVENDFIRR